MQLPEHHVPVTSHDHLVNVLAEYDISTARWGVSNDENNTRTSNDLWSEIDLGEAILYKDESGLYRYNATVKAQVYYALGRSTLLLYESRRHDYVRETEYTRSLHNSVSEKRRAGHGETPKSAILRGLREELRGDHDEEIITAPRIVLGASRHHPTVQERHYPGLLSATETHYFDVLLLPEQYRPNGYVERKYNESKQLVRATSFEWRNKDSGLPQTLRES